jgi:hypothetical protein
MGNVRQALLETLDFIMETLRLVLVICLLWLLAVSNGLIILYNYYYLVELLLSFVPINAVTKMLLVAFLSFSAVTALIFICLYLEEVNDFIIEQLNEQQPTTKLGRKILSIIKKYW